MLRLARLCASTVAGQQTGLAERSAAIADRAGDRTGRRRPESPDGHPRLLCGHRRRHRRLLLRSLVRSHSAVKEEAGQAAEKEEIAPFLTLSSAETES